MQLFFIKPVYLISICLGLIAAILFLTPVEELRVGETVYANAPHVRLRSSPPKSLSERNYDSKYLDPDEVWIVLGTAQGATENPHSLGLWLEIEHPHNGRRGWVASWLVERSPRVVTPLERRTRVAGEIAASNSRRALAGHLHDLAALAAIASALIAGIALRLQRKESNARVDSGAQANLSSD